MSPRLILITAITLAGLAWSPHARAATPPEIVAPAAGAVVTSPFTVEATYGDIAYCDTGGCFDVPAATIKLYADPDMNQLELASCMTATECMGGKATFQVDLDPGKHVLEVIAYDDAFSLSASEKLEITVEAAATTGDTGGATTGATTSATSSATTDATSSATTDATTGATDSASSGGDDKDDGCGCRSTGDGPGAALAVLLTAGLLRRRRSRR
jgi:MYXO-CTERM domain-containing protein